LRNCLRKNSKQNEKSLVKWLDLHERPGKLVRFARATGEIGTICTSYWAKWHDLPEPVCPKFEANQSKLFQYVCRREMHTFGAGGWAQLLLKCTHRPKNNMIAFLNCCLCSSIGLHMIAFLNCCLCSSLLVRSVSYAVLQSTHECFDSVLSCHVVAACAHSYANGVMIARAVDTTSVTVVIIRMLQALS
jgi:hypothetical protein